MYVKTYFMFFCLESILWTWPKLHRRPVRDSRTAIFYEQSNLFHARFIFMLKQVLKVPLLSIKVNHNMLV